MVAYSSALTNPYTKMKKDPLISCEGKNYVDGKLKHWQSLLIPKGYILNIIYSISNQF